MPRVVVLGAGSWGSALAILLARAGHPTTLWGRDPGALRAMRRERCNPRYLPGHPFPPELDLEPALERALASTDLVVVAVPSAGFREILETTRALGCVDPVVWVAKGLDPRTGRWLHQTAGELLDPDTPRAVLSGPTFAGEVAAGLPAAVTLASADAQFARRAAEVFHGPTLRAYTSTDLVGVEVGGVVKNVLAIAAGVADGLGFGANTRAALIARGLREMTRFGEAIGARAETLMGLSGLGDLVLTCTDDQSRNRRFGLEIGRGSGVEAALAAVGQTVEGVGSAERVWRLARRRRVAMPIVEQVDAVLHRGRDPGDAVRALLARPAGSEHS